MYKGRDTDHKICTIAIYIYSPLLGKSFLTTIRISLLCIHNHRKRTINNHGLENAMCSSVWNCNTYEWKYDLRSLETQDLKLKAKRFNGPSWYMSYGLNLIWHIIFWLFICYVPELRVLNKISCPTYFFHFQNRFRKKNFPKCQLLDS